MQNENILLTEQIRDQIARCESLEELKENIFPELQTQQRQWVTRINKILEDTGYGKTEFGEICGVSRVTVNKWCNGSIPKRRETFLIIGMAAGYDTAQTNQLLQRYGRYPALYSKSLEDCACIFVLNHAQSLDSREKIATYRQILDRIKNAIVRNDAAEAEEIDTEKFDEKLSDVRDEEELERFVTDNIAVFSGAYHKFYMYVLQYVEENKELYKAANVYELALGQGWTSSLRQCISAIRQKKWYPTRNKILSLGLHLGMEHEDVDEMLELAHMEPLCSRNIFESVLMFILDDAAMNDITDPDEICVYARDVLSRMELPEVDAFISELAEIGEEEE